MISALRAMTPPPGQGEDPYAPPAELASTGGIPDAPHSFGWRMENGRLWVAKSSRLPMIDVFSGQLDETMQMRQLEVRYRPKWLRWLPLAAATLMIVIGWFREDGFDPFTFISVFAVVWIIAMFISATLPKCMVRFYLTKQTLRIRKIYDITMQVSFLLLIFGSPLFSFAGDIWSTAIPTVAGIIWITGLIVGFWIQRRLSCRKTRDDQFELRGIHRNSLAYLSEIHAARSAR